MHNWRDGLDRVPLHLATWGLLSVVASVWLHWIPVAFVFGAALRGEVQDIWDKNDTVSKALIDFVSQTGLSVVYVLWRG